MTESRKKHIEEMNDLPQTKAAKIVTGRTLGSIYGPICGPINGQKNVESGHIQSLGKKQGRYLVESGILASYRTLEHQSEACRKRNEIHGNPQTKEGSMKGACGLCNIKRGKPCTCGQHIKVIEG